MSGLDPELLDPPWALHERLRRDTPVVEVEELGFHLVSRYEDVLRILKDPDTFSNEFPGMFGTGLSFAPATPGKEAAQAKGYRWEPTLFFSDAPAHRRHRSVLQQAFSPRRVRQLEDMVQRLCDEIIDGFDTSGPVDLADGLAFRLPVMVIGEALGVQRDRPRAIPQLGRRSRPATRRAAAGGGGHRADRALRRGAAVLRARDRRAPRGAA